MDVRGANFVGDHLEIVFARQPQPRRREGARVAETDEGSERTTTARPDATDDGPARSERRTVCTVAFCPICMAVTASQGAAPDVRRAPAGAAREFFLAVRAVVDARGDHLSGGDANPNGSKDFERIEIS